MLYVNRRLASDPVLSDIAQHSNVLNYAFSEGSLFDIFDTSKRGHDGAAIITLFDEGTGEFSPRIHSTGNMLPADSSHSAAALADRGLRHHSAFLMSQLTNSTIVTISEERGSISVFHRGTVQSFESGSVECGLRCLKKAVMVAVIESFAYDLKVSYSNHS